VVLGDEGVVVLDKQCKCGEMMNVGLRTVIFRNRVEIGNVPVYSCDSCHRNEVMTEVKPALTLLIEQLEEEDGKQSLNFEDFSELALLMVKVSSRERMEDPVEQIIEERINELLDMLLLARSVGDRSWMQDIRGRLAQLTRHTSVYDFS
jgi:hypothetical protein